VRALNTRVESFPSNLVASSFGFHKEEYFEVEMLSAMKATLPRK
jgi:LemA protein